MSKNILDYPNIIRLRRALGIALIAILLLASLALMTGRIRDRLSPATPDAYQVDRIPVVQNSIGPISVPVPPRADIRRVQSETPSLASVVVSEPDVLSIPVPTPPS